MVSVIINYCSNERIFINHVLAECSKFSNDIVVSYGNRLYDGSNEDMIHINVCKEKFANVRFVEYDVDINLNLQKQKGVNQRPAAYWHNLARWTAVQSLNEKEWVFVIDADEIPDGDLVKEWLDNFEMKKDECYKIATHWFFKHPTNQANMLEDSILLIHYDYLTETNIFGDYERDHLINVSGCKLKRQTKGLGGCVLWNHYSWVRSKDALIHKIKNWGHSSDIFKNVDVNKLVDYIYRNDDVNDIVHGYTYTKVDNKYNIVV